MSSAFVALRPIPNNGWVSVLLCGGSRAWMLRADSIIIDDDGGWGGFSYGYFVDVALVFFHLGFWKFYDVFCYCLETFLVNESCFDNQLIDLIRID